MRNQPLFKPDVYEWIKQHTTIDLLNIDDEVSQMPTLLQECGECAAFAAEIRDAAKDELEKAKAEAAEWYRTTPLDNGKDRSETAIASQIPLDKTYRQRQQELSDARVDASLWQNLYEAVKTKNFSLRTTADLIVSGYLTQDHILQRRRKDIRRANPKVESKVPS